MRIFLSTYLGRSFLFWSFMSRPFFMWGGGVHVHPVHPPAYAPDAFDLTLEVVNIKIYAYNFHSSSNLIVFKSRKRARKLPTDPPKCSSVSSEMLIFVAGNEDSTHWHSPRSIIPSAVFLADLVFRSFLPILRFTV